jgi:peptidoglycan/xylan/chitin deacetylase (PgdA/CDA1 family)
MAFKHVAMLQLGHVAALSGVAALATKKYGGAGSILTLHSVVRDDDFLPRENVHTSVSFLERMIRYYLSQRIPIISLSDAVARLEARSTQRFVSFTFDDGYRDNLTLALPIFKKYNLPFTIYVTSAYLERNYGKYWWGQLRHLVMENLAVEVVDSRIPMGSPKDKIRAYKKLMGWIEDGTLRAGRLAALFEQYHLAATEALDRDALNENELAKASREEPLLEIGGHTSTHDRLTELDDLTASTTIRENKIQLESIIEREVRHFAYPFGDANSCGEREFRLAEAAGFATAVTTRIGNLFSAHLERPLCLPRLRFLGPCESVGFMECQRSGAVTALMTRFGNPVRTA